VTQLVKHHGGVENRGLPDYNVQVSKALLALICAPLLMGGACEKKSPKAADTGAINALDQAGSGSALQGPDGPVDTSPLAGIDTSSLSSDKQGLFFRLVGSLSSPCGKAHSLRTSFTQDTACKRAPFAVRYVKQLIEDEANEGQIREEFEKKYKPPAKKVAFELAKEPRIGAADAPIRLVEFYDYGCPHCAEFRTTIDRLLEDDRGKIQVYFLHYNLGHFPNSQEAAQAALAAHAQGKFKEMHDLLFEHRSEHAPDALAGYAKQLGLDAAKFKADYDAAQNHVLAQKAQGENAGVDSTPTLYFNDRKYEGPMHSKYIQMWIDEELAVNR
jgi:protein-disulfide isomerase